MTYQIKSPKLFNIYDDFGNQSFGGNQDWYSSNLKRRSGCGPTSAANLTAYLALTDPTKKQLYSYTTMKQSDFAKHMETLFDYVTPGTMGVNHLQMFIDGLHHYANERSVPITLKHLSVNRKNRQTRSLNALTEFVIKGLSNDNPIAFLALSRGQEKRLQNWHWITITQAHIENDQIIATASDEGNIRRFDLSLWYMTTKMHGGLVYIDNEKTIV